MSGHSRWSKVKHQKAITDVRKGKIFSKMAKMITVAARKSGDPESNPALRLAIDKAKSINMPNVNIERAIKKGTGELKGEKLETTTYEAYGPDGVAIIIESITDNKNRALSEIRHILNQHGGRLGEKGSVEWMFQRKGLIEAEGKENKEELELIAIDRGAEDIKWKNNTLEIYTKPTELTKVKENLENAGIKIKDISLDWIPKTEVSPDSQIKSQLEKLFEALDEQEDVEEIYSNLKLE